MSNMTIVIARPLLNNVYLDENILKKLCSLCQDAFAEKVTKLWRINCREYDILNGGLIWYGFMDIDTGFT